MTGGAWITTHDWVMIVKKNDAFWAYVGMDTRGPYTSAAAAHADLPGRLPEDDIETMLAPSARDTKEGKRS